MSISIHTRAKKKVREFMYRSDYIYIGTKQVFHGIVANYMYIYTVLFIPTLRILFLGNGKVTMSVCATYTFRCTNATKRVYNIRVGIYKTFAYPACFVDAKHKFMFVYSTRKNQLRFPGIRVTHIFVDATKRCMTDTFLLNII